MCLQGLNHLRWKRGREKRKEEIRERTYLPDGLFSSWTSRATDSKQSDTPRRAGDAKNESRTFSGARGGGFVKRKTGEAGEEKEHSPVLVFGVTILVATTSDGQCGKGVIMG